MRVLIASDDQLMRAALARAVLALLPSAYLAQASDLAEVVSRLADRPDLLLLDIRTPGLGGTDAVHRLRLAWPDQRMVVAPAAADTAFIRSALALHDRQDGRAAALCSGSSLTPRQLQVLHLLMQGHPNKLIARVLGLTEGTVKIHIAAILRSLQARNRTEAVMVARRLGIGG